MQVREHEPLARYTSWRIGGPARYFATVTSVDDLRGLVQWAIEKQLPFFVLGGGTNVLISDGGYPGLVIRNRAKAYRLEEQADEVTLWIESGAPTAGTVRRLAGEGIGGLEWAEGLPGTIGGAIFGNAGCYGGDIAQHLLQAWVLRNGAVENWPVARLAYGYRTSALKRVRQEAAVSPGLWPSREEALPSGVMGEQDKDPSPAPASVSLREEHPPVILAAELHLQRDDPARLEARMAEIAAARRGKTPAGSSCGSVFKNPPGTTAGTLLDQAGLKGVRIGNAIVSDKHANYIVNLGGATASDVLRLTDMMRERVLTYCRVELELEVQVVGETL
jgi:UDP-N-acetylmuramate dehydrogenase